MVDIYLYAGEPIDSHIRLTDPTKVRASITYWPQPPFKGKVRSVFEPVTTGLLIISGGSKLDYLRVFYPRIVPGAGLDLTSEFDLAISYALRQRILFGLASRTRAHKHGSNIEDWLLLGDDIFQEVN